MDSVHTLADMNPDKERKPRDEDDDHPRDAMPNGG
jgi:hypothetical protein